MKKKNGRWTHGEINDIQRFDRTPAQYVLTIELPNGDEVKETLKTKTDLMKLRWVAKDRIRVGSIVPLRQPSSNIRKLQTNYVIDLPLSLRNMDKWLYKTKRNLLKYELLQPVPHSSLPTYTPEENGFIIPIRTQVISSALMLPFFISWAFIGYYLISFPFFSDTINFIIFVISSILYLGFTAAVGIIALIWIIIQLNTLDYLKSKLRLTTND